MLENYFEPGKLKYKPLEVLFNLDVLDIFQYAFLKIPLWKQLFIRVMGRYESYRKTFTGMSLNLNRTPVASVNSSKESNDEPDFSHMTREQRKQEFKKRQSFNKSKVRRSSSLNSEPLVKKRHYTQKEQNEAWSEFGSSFSKKKISDDNKLSDL
jgi:hypothetical protein